jgi:hypothetical protein
MTKAGAGLVQANARVRGKPVVRRRVSACSRRRRCDRRRNADASTEAIASMDDRRCMKPATLAAQGTLLDDAYTGHDGEGAALAILQSGDAKA